MLNFVVGINEMKYFHCRIEMVIYFPDVMVSCDAADSLVVITNIKMGLNNLFYSQFSKTCEKLWYIFYVSLL